MENYEKIKVVGRGAYGTVHLCQRHSDKLPVIIKQIPVEQMTKDERQAALNEVKVLSMLDHPFIVKYFENFLEDKALMIVMEYAEGGTLFEHLQQRGNNVLEEEELIRFFSQMVLAMQHVHSKQILHRDLKTQNILLNKKKNIVKLSDFGISKVLSSKSKAYTVVGTPCYISPELCEGKPYNQKSDIWALGCVLYELATLKRAFEAANLPALVLKIMRGMVSPVSDVYSDQLKQLILDMLQLDPDKRPTINQLMAHPLVLNGVLELHTELGKIPCRHRPLSNVSPAVGKSQLSRTSSMTSRADTVSTSADISHKQQIYSQVYCWGGGITLPVLLPLPGNETRITQVAIGRTQKAGVTESGRLVLWEPVQNPADNAESPVPGTATHQISFVPRFLEGQSAVTIAKVSCGDLFIACLTDRGILLTFGSGAHGCLGHGNYNDVSQAKIVEALLGFEIVDVSCGTTHVMVITNDNEVYSWGRGDNGRLGLGNQESFASPQLVPIIEGYQGRSIHCGVDGSMLVTTIGEVLACGSNRYNKLGLDAALDGSTRHVEDASLFTKVRTPPLCDITVKSASLGSSHTALLTTDCLCYMFGSNQFGQLGYNRLDVHVGLCTSNRVSLKSERDTVAMVTCGDTFTVAVSEDGTVYTWGKGTRGRLGRTEMDSSLPQAVNLPPNSTITSLCSSHGSTIVCCDT